MKQELWTLVPLQYFIAKFDPQDAQFDNLAVISDQNRTLRELMILPIDLVIELEKL